MTTDSTQPAKLQAYVDYLPGISIAGAKSALLEWSADDRIKLFILDDQASQATEVLFDVPVSEIQNVGGSMILLAFTVANTTYNVQFSRTAMAKMSIGGGVGLASASKDMDKSGIKLWIDALRANKIPMNGYKGWAWSATLALIILAVIGIGLLIYVAVLVATAGV